MNIYIFYVFAFAMFTKLMIKAIPHERGAVVNSVRMNTDKHSTSILTLRVPAEMQVECD